ncbi:MAG: GNAT family N-acetyltransferase [Flavobacteriaceae bacterium]
MADTVDRVRDASRRMVRELGFLRSGLAGTRLSASAVHAIVETGLSGTITASALSDRLLLEKSTVSRLVASLADAGLIDRAPAEDRRSRLLRLTAVGQRRYAAITRTAERRVADALDRLGGEERESVAGGLEAYAGALAASRAAGSSAPRLELRDDYAPGLVARIVAMHADYYSRETSLGAAFEAHVANGLGEFVPRLASPGNRLWHVRAGGRIAGGIAIDGEDLGGGVAHLRWFIVDDMARGTGAGRLLLDAALGFCDASGFAAVRLWTFRGLDAARHLYETRGFALVGEYDGDQWGPVLREQIFERPRGG